MENYISLHRLILALFSSKERPSSKRNRVGFGCRLEFVCLLEFPHFLLRLFLVVVELADAQRIRSHCSNLGWEHSTSSVRNNIPVDSTKESMLLNVISISGTLAKTFAGVSVKE